MVNNFLFCVCVCVLQVTWRANGIVLYMYEGNVLMDINYVQIVGYLLILYLHTEFRNDWFYTITDHVSLC